MSAACLSIALDPIPETCPERQVIDRLLALDGKRILELGCGRAEITRQLALGGPRRDITALEVDEIQHAKNLALGDLPNVRFLLAGAEAIPLADESIDVAFMFKSLHHVPVSLMAQAFSEIARVLVPGGHAYISEPIFAGDFNDILRLFHDERQVRQAAFDALRAAVEGGVLESVEQVFFNAPVHFPDFVTFESRIIGATHTRHVLDADTYAEVRRRFESHAGRDGVRFAQPMRVNLLRRPPAR